MEDSRRRLVMLVRSHQDAELLLLDVCSTTFRKHIHFGACECRSWKDWAPRKTAVESRHRSRTNIDDLREHRHWYHSLCGHHLRNETRRRRRRWRGIRKVDLLLPDRRWLSYRTLNESRDARWRQPFYAMSSSYTSLQQTVQDDR